MYRFLVLFLLNNLVAAECPSKWVRYKDACYMAQDLQTDIIDAEPYCHSISDLSHMVSIHSKDENDFVGSRFLNAEV